MKKRLLTGLLVLGTLSAARASLYYQGTGISGDVNMGALQAATIVDGNPAAVIANTMNLSGLGATLSDLTVSVSLTGGMNSGLYAYLVSPNDTVVILMNQPGVAQNGFGATGTGMNITLSDAGFTSIQSVTSGSVLGGTYQADGSLSGFDGGNPNGAWTLYFADTIAGGGNATLNGWSLDITAVPEPVGLALGFVAGLMALGTGLRHCRNKLKATGN